MPVLKRLRLPLYYKNDRKKGICFELLDTSIYVKPEEADIIEANVDKKVDAAEDPQKVVESKPKKDKKAKKGDKDGRKGRVAGEYSVRITFDKDSLTKTQRKTIKTELSDALSSKKAHTYFFNLIKDTAVHAMTDPDDLLAELKTHSNNKKLYHFHHRSSSKNSVLYSIIPHKSIPKSFANKEMLESFLFNVAKVEIGQIAPIKSIVAEFN